MDHATAEQLVQLAYAAIDATDTFARADLRIVYGAAADLSKYHDERAAAYLAARTAERALVEALRDLARGGEG